MHNMWKVVMVAGLTFMAPTAQAQPTVPNPVTYTGCLSIDPTACGTFFFRKVLGQEGVPTYWYFVPPPMLRGSQGQLYYVLDTFAFYTPTGACNGRTSAYVFLPGSCTIRNRFNVSYEAEVEWFTQDGQQLKAPITFAAVAPEPGTLLLLATGLGAAGLKGRRRRRA